MPLPDARRYIHWTLAPIADPATGVRPWDENPSIDLVRELLRRHTELPSYGASRFAGSRSAKAELWGEYRNYLHQAISYFDAATLVKDRSACLLLYYALLNFAKAELLKTNAGQIKGKRIGHGISYGPTRAKKLTSDTVITQKDGVFPLLYQKRVGKAIAPGQRLPVTRLLANIPEVSSQLVDTAVAVPNVKLVFQMLASDDSSSWPLLLSFSDLSGIGTSSGRLFRRFFREVQYFSYYDWRDHFGLSRRTFGQPRFYESTRTVPFIAPDTPNLQGASAITWQLRDILSAPTYASADALITPSLYSSKMLPMPASLARYVVIFYGSSIVRYRPTLFDRHTYPQDAYLFDAIARECVLPIVVDVLNCLEGATQLFLAPDALRR